MAQRHDYWTHGIATILESPQLAQVVQHRSDIGTLVEQNANTSGWFHIPIPTKFLSTAWVARHGLTSAQYQAEFEKWTSQGYRLTMVSGYEVSNADYYAAIWEKTTGPSWVARHGLSSSQYQAEFDKWVGEGFRLVHVDGYTVNNQDRYAAIWVKATGPAWVARHGMISSQYQAEFDKYVAQGFRLTDVTGYTVDKQPRYAAIWEKTAGPTWQARHGLTSAQYQSVFNTLVSQGYRLILVNGYTVEDQDRYACIFAKQPGRGWVARHGMTSAEYQGEFDNYAYQGHRLKCVSGYAAGGQARYAALWESDAVSDADLALIDGKIKSYMSKHAIPGLSLAIAKDERLVYAEGYGHADTSMGEKVNPRHLFRVASIAKPITAVAVMDLVEHGKLQLDGKVFGSGALLGTTYGIKPYSDKVKSINVRHLLQHTSGFSNDGGDPMFMNYNMDHAALIGWVLDNRGVKNEPGAVYEYLNFGYCVLGRIIERVTGQSYEDYLRNVVLKQCGVSRMWIGGDTLAERKPGEVVYYGSGAYNMKVRRMDAHGGWIASPIDLLRFMVRTDGFAKKVDILYPATEDAMFSGSDANESYGLGWIVTDSYHGHNGAMPGTIGFLVRRDDGYSFAVLANTRPAGDAYCFELKGVLDSIVTSVSLWPGYDLF
jgi:CubicO group peptidase (beta-lactamase class C family)